MDIPKSELFSVLQEFNPWWSGQPLTDLPDWERSAVEQVWDWSQQTGPRRALLLSGARQVGKTTVFRQTIRRLMASGIPATHVLYATFDHPLLKLAGLEKALQAWEELFPPPLAGHPRLLFLDEIQYVPDWQTWVKHRVDFQPGTCIAMTGSADPLHQGSSESGVGRWETLPLPTLSFAEYLRLRKVEVPELAPLRSLRQLFDWRAADFALAANAARPLTAHFHEYLLRGGFPEPALAQDLTRCQRLLREDIVDKVLKRDMTAFYGVRRVLEVEKIFLYLCYHDGGILDLPTLTQQLESVNRQTALNFLDLFESTHLIYRLKPFGYGKEILRGRDKVYLADAALPGAVLLLGRRLLEQPERLGAAVETAFFKHVFTRYYRLSPRFAYWQDKRHRDLEVDLIAQMGERIVPFEVKYHDAEITPKRLRGMRLFMEERGVGEGYVITQRWDDFKVLDVPSARRGAEDAAIGRIAAIPAPLACYWLLS